MSPDSSSEQNWLFSRRNALALVAGAGVGAGVSRLVGTDSETPDPNEQDESDYQTTTGDNEGEPDSPWYDEMEERINVVDHDGIDHTGGLATELLSFINTLDTVNHQFIIPEGTYFWNTTLAVDGFEYLGILGEPEATLDITEQIDTPFQMGRWDVRGSEHFELGNLTVDSRGTAADGYRIDTGLLNANIEYQATIANLELIGERGYAQKENGVGDKYTHLLNILDEGGEAHVRNVRLSDGDERLTPSQFDHAIGFSADPPHRGTTHYEHCYIEGFSDNGYYLSNSSGANILHECEAVNNYGPNIRLGENDECYDSYIRIDNPYGENSEDNHFLGSGLWIHMGSPLVEGLTIDAPHASNDLIRVNSDAAGGTLRDVTVNAGANATGRTLRLTQNAETTTAPLVFENLTINDDVSYEDRNRAFSGVIERENVTFRNCDFNISEGDHPREGLRVTHPEVTFEECRIESANNGTILELVSNHTSFRDGELVGTGDDAARFAVTGDIDPETVSIAGTTLDNVYFEDWAEEDVTEDKLR